MKRVLITGVSGYVGSHTAKYFFSQGWDVFGLDRRACPSYVSPYIQDFTQLEIGDEARVIKFCQQHSIVAIVHCAALCLVAESVAKPELYFENNVVQGKAFLHALQYLPKICLVFSSTAAVYGEPKIIPIPEDHPKVPVNPYGETKLLFENELLKQSQIEDFPVGIFRYFNAAGADPDGQLGEVHEPETHIIPNAILAALGRNPDFAIFGQDFDTRDGTCERDYVHVWDLARAHFMMTERMLSGHEGGTFNLGVGQGYTVKEVVEGVCQAAGVPAVFRQQPRRPGDPARLIADPRRARDVLGWETQYSELSQIIDHALRWHRQHDERVQGGV